MPEAVTRCWEEENITMTKAQSCVTSWNFWFFKNNYIISTQRNICPNWMFSEPGARVTWGLPLWCCLPKAKAANASWLLRENVWQKDPIPYTFCSTFSFHLLGEQGECGRRNCQWPRKVSKTPKSREYELLSATDISDQGRPGLPQHVSLKGEPGPIYSSGSSGKYRKGNKILPPALFDYRACDHCNNPFILFLSMQPQEREVNTQGILHRWQQKFIYDRLEVIRVWQGQWL